MLAEGKVKDVESAIWIVFVFHFICRSGETDGSNDEGWMGIPKANIASKTRIAFARRIRENYLNSREQLWLIFAPLWSRTQVGG